MRTRSSWVYSFIFRVLPTLCAAALLSGCESLFFYPSPYQFSVPREVGIKAEDIFFHNRDGNRLHGWFLPARGEAVGTVLFLHGNAENISSHIASVYWLPAESFNVFLPDYRGYGQSEGNPTMGGLIDDSEDALAWLMASGRVDPRRIVLFGQSLGGAVALNVASREANRSKLQALIVDSTFSSFPEIVRDKLRVFWVTWVLQYPLTMFTSNRYSPIAAVKKLDGLPLLILHGENDEIVPAYHSPRLFEAAGEPKELWMVPGAAHIEALRRQEYRARFVNFLKPVLTP